MTAMSGSGPLGKAEAQICWFGHPSHAANQMMYHKLYLCESKIDTTKEPLISQISKRTRVKLGYNEHVCDQSF